MLMESAQCGGDRDRDVVMIREPSGMNISVKESALECKTYQVLL